MIRLVPVALLAWIPITIELFVLLKPRRAVLAAFLVGWMFLPVAPYVVAGTPAFAKMSVISLAPLLSVTLFDFRRLLSFRILWIDVPILIFCFSPFASAMVNGLGVREGLSSVFFQAVTWGIPYAMGRLYFDDLPSLRELATGIFAGGIIYAPLCLFEFWRGPHLHKLLYGYDQVVSLRPQVFMENALMVSLWIAASVVLGFWLWRSDARASLARVPLLWLIPVLVITSILLNCGNGWVLMVLGVGMLVLASRVQSAAPMVCVMALILLHMALRGTGLWSGDQAVSTLAEVNTAKAHSISYRFVNEDMIAANARQHPIFGWGRQPEVLYDEAAGISAVADSLWILTLAQYGIVGLIGLTASLLFPVGLFIARFPAGEWREASVGPAAALAVMLVLYMTDHLANAMINPVYMLAAGGLTGLSGGPAYPRE